MPSGGITITPGKILADGEKVSNAKLNQGFRPVGRVDEGAITDRELAGSVNNLLGQVPGVNQLCNGDFSIWMLEEIGTDPGAVFSGVIAGGRKTDIATVNHWFIANDANRKISRQEFAIGQTEVPDHPRYFLHWLQNPPVDAGIPLAYFGQRLENVRLYSGATVTFSIWVRTPNPGPVTPQVRQFFGTGGSADVVTDGDSQDVGVAWTEIKQIFQIPSVNGKSINDLYAYNSNLFSSFTEFRIAVPGAHDAAFQMDFAHAMLSYGDFIPGWDARPPNADYLFASRYEQYGGIVLSSSLTNFLPFVNLRVPMLATNAGLDAKITLTFGSGTGGTLGGHPVYQAALVQANVHSVVAAATYRIQAELHAPT